MTRRQGAGLLEGRDGGDSGRAELTGDSEPASLVTEEHSAPEPKRRLAIPPRDLNALAGALLFVAFSLAAIYVVAQVAEVEDGAVLAALLIAPALLYLLLSGRVSELKGPAGLEVRLSEAAKQTIPVPGDDHSALPTRRCVRSRRGAGRAFSAESGTSRPRSRS